MEKWKVRISGVGGNTGGRLLKLIAHKLEELFKLGSINIKLQQIVGVIVKDFS